jgi:hypothetical protein
MKMAKSLLPKQAPQEKNAEAKRRFIRQLAEFLAGNQGGKSIALEVEAKMQPVIDWANQWAALRRTTPLFGYPTVEEAEKILSVFLK